MDNNEQSNQEITKTESLTNEPQKAKTTRRPASKPAKEGKGATTKTTRKPRAPRTAKAKQIVAEISTVEVSKADDAIVAQTPNNNDTKAEKQAIDTTEVAITTSNSMSQTTEEQQDDNQPADVQIKQAESLNAMSQADAPHTANVRPEQKVPPLPSTRINNIIDLAQAPMRNIVLTDQQIQQLTLEEIEKRHLFLEETLARVLDYDVVVSDTNIWLELLVGYTSSHSDPRFNARLQFERQLEFISKLTYYRGGRFMIMGETYEEIDRFASMQDPANHRDADFTDNVVCLNTAARLAKRLILAQQRENRLRIDGIGAESHHASFADPAIIRKVADLFAEGKKVLLLTNDASVAIRTMGICDDLQRHNNISDTDWDEKYAPLRPMVFTFDDLKQLDFYTRQYHYIQMAAGAQWMEDIAPKMQRNKPEPLTLYMDAFRQGDRRRSDNLFTDNEKQTQQKQKIQKQQEQQKKQLAQQEQKKKQGQPQQNSQQQKKQEQQQASQNPDAPTANKTAEEPVANINAPQQELIPTDTTATAEKKEEQKPNPRSRRKPQRGRRSNMDRTAEKAVTANNA